MNLYKLKNYIPPHPNRIFIFVFVYLFIYFPRLKNGSPLGILWSQSFAIVRASLWAALIELLPVYDCWHGLTQLPTEFIFWACLHCAALRYCLGTSGRVWWETFQTGRYMFWLVGTPDAGRKEGVWGDFPQFSIFLRCSLHSEKTIKK